MTCLLIIKTYPGSKLDKYNYHWLSSFDNYSKNIYIPAINCLNHLRTVIMISWKTHKYPSVHYNFVLVVHIKQHSLFIVDLLCILLSHIYNWVLFWSNLHTFFVLMQILISFHVWIDIMKRKRPILVCNITLLFEAHPYVRMIFTRREKHFKAINIFVLLARFYLAQKINNVKIIWRICSFAGGRNL